MLAYSGRIWIYLLPVPGLVVVLAGLYALIVLPGKAVDEQRPEIRLYCAFEVTEPIDEIAEHFQRRTGIRVHIHHELSHLLLNRIKLADNADLFLPVDDSYLFEAKKAGMALRSRPLACLVPVIMVSNKNPHDIRSVTDLLLPNVRVGLANKETTLGKVTSGIFQKHNIKIEDVKNNDILNQAPAQLAQNIELGQIDAAIVWRPMAQPYLVHNKIIEIPQEHNILSLIAVTILKKSAQPDTAEQFVEFLAGNLAKNIFLKYGYEVDTELLVK